MLQAAAIALVGERGLAAVTVDDIATAAGVSRRTFFNHFPAKAAALFDPDPSDAERLARLLADADGAGDPWQALATVCVDFVSGHEDVIAVRRRLVAESPELDQYHRTAHQHVEITLGEWAHAQPGLNDFDATLLAQTAAAIMITAFYTWRPDDPADLLPQLVRRGFDRVAEGL
jgi:AcrR family transcriptional regulator